MSEPLPRVPGYRILGRLGEGGMGVVYRAREEASGRRVALKLLPPGLAADREAKGRLLREAILHATLRHPHVCSLVGSGETEEGDFYFATELLAGETLQELLRRELPALERAVGIARQAAAGLAAAHDRGIVHRDVKPANLMLTAEGTKVLDFGLAGLDFAGWIDRAASRVGTLFYASPEQLSGGEVDPRADVWSLGAVLYEAIGGRPPFVGGAADEVRQAILDAVRAPPPDLPALRPEAPAELVGVVERCLAPAPADRFTDAGEVEDALAGVAGAAAEADRRAAGDGEEAEAARPWWRSLLGSG